MSGSYTGDGTGITIATDPITITEPADGDDLVAASDTTEAKKLADFIAALRDRVLSFTPTVHLVGATGEPAFGTNWGGSPTQGVDPGFYKDALGNVRGRGVIKSVGAAADTNNLFTLPTGYRPAGDKIFPGLQYDSSAIALLPVSLIVKTDGRVQAHFGTAMDTGDLVYLDGVIFDPST